MGGGNVGNGVRKEGEGGAESIRIQEEREI